MIPATPDISSTLVSTAKVGIWVDAFRVFPSGFQFTLALRVNPAVGELTDGLEFDSLPRGDGRNVLELRLRYPDGRETSPLIPEIVQAQRNGLVLGGPRFEGGAPGWQVRWWAWPLPPRGPVQVSCEWRAAEIPRTSVEIDGGILLDAAATADVLWPEAE